MDSDPCEGSDFQITEPEDVALLTLHSGRKVWGAQAGWDLSPGLLGHTMLKHSCAVEVLPSGWG